MDNNPDQCCPVPAQDPHDHGGHGYDLIFSGSVFVILTALAAGWFFPGFMPLHHFNHALLGILGALWWAVLAGVVIVGLMGHVPREYFNALMGRGDGIGGLFRAVLAGLLLDLCCHGILLVAGKLYERGVSIAQVMTFLVASPWNSVSLTLVLIGLIGWKWTLVYILGSMVIALMTGAAFQALVRTGVLPENPNRQDMPEDFRILPAMRGYFRNIRFSVRGALGVLRLGWKDGKMIVKWLLFGTIIAASLDAFVPEEVFADWFGPSVAGLFLTVAAATVIEICSEGSAPVAAQIFTIARAPGNAFAFLMAGVATDYTEILAVREFTKSWPVAIALPLITVPQVLLVGWIMNAAY